MVHLNNSVLCTLGSSNGAAGTRGRQTFAFRFLMVTDAYLQQIGPLAKFAVKIKVIFIKCAL